MSQVVTTKSPIFWLIVAAGVILPMLTMSTTLRAVLTTAVVAFIVTGIVRGRRRPVRPDQS